MKDAMVDWLEKHKQPDEHLVTFGALGLLFEHFIRTLPKDDRVKHGMVDAFADIQHGEINRPSPRAQVLN